MMCIYKENREERLFRKYVADCVGAFIRSKGIKDFPLYSELINHKVKKEPTANQILDHVKHLFS